MTNEIMIVPTANEVPSPHFLQFQPHSRRQIVDQDSECWKLEEALYVDPHWVNSVWKYSLPHLLTQLLEASSVYSACVLTGVPPPWEHWNQDCSNGGIGGLVGE